MENETYRSKAAPQREAALTPCVGIIYLAEISVSAPEGGSCGTSSPSKGTLFRVVGTLEYNNKDDVEDILNTLAVVAFRPSDETLN